ncbi:MAG TPA: glycosyltransferase [Steroidobacteraceae bacterium]|nr:glycosyltransferase [Steroidobacteraceae bacterium]
MRILQIVESLEVGGAERVVVNLANALAQSNDVAIVCTKRIGALRDQLSDAVKVECLDKREGNDFRLPQKLANCIRSFRAEVVHSHHWGVLLDAGLAVAHANDAVFVHTVHGKYPSYSPGLISRTKKQLRHFLERRVSRRAESVVCVSEELIDYVQREVGIARNKLRVIVNGTSIADPVQRASGGSEELTLVTVGRLAAVKNHALLLRAFALLHAQGLRLQLKIVGDGPERGKLEAQVRATGIQDRVEFLGFRSDVSAVLASADVFVLSSISEGLPMAALEAMQVSLPIVATRVGGMPQVVSEGTNGFLVDSGNAEQLADRIRFLAEHRGVLVEYGKASRALLVRNFSAATMVDAYKRVYGKSNST